MVIEQNWIFNFSKNVYVLISIRLCERGKIINTVIFVGTIIWFSVRLHTVVMCIVLYPSILLSVTLTIFQGTAASKNWNCWKMYCLVCSCPVKLRLCMIVKNRDLRIHCRILSLTLAYIKGKQTLFNGDKWCFPGSEILLGFCLFLVLFLTLLVWGLSVVPWLLLTLSSTGPY